MLKQLKFEVQFASTGKTLSGDHALDTGITAITGENEKGKSMRIEMVRFALWGSKALRAKNLSSYKILKASLDFSVKNVDYKVVRSLKSAVLKRGDEELATGTSVVNEAIIRIFGYDMEVFDIANAVLQGEVNEMTNKTPAERKRMVDKTIGLDSLDDLIKKYTNDISLQKRVLEALEKQQIENPVLEPQPYGYDKSENVDAELRKTEAFVIRSKTLTAQLEAAKPKVPLPAKPEQTLHMVSLNQLLEQKIKRNEVIRDLDRVKKHHAGTTWTKPDLKQLAVYREYLDKEQYRVWADFDQFMKAEISLEKYAGFNIEKLEKAKQALIAQPMFAELEKLYSSPRVTCPSCSHDFFLNHEQVENRIDEIKKELPFDDVNYLNTILAWIAEQKLTPRLIDEAIDGAKRYAEHMALPRPIQPTMDNLGIKEVVEAQIALIELQKTTYDGKEKLEKEISELETKLAGISDPSTAIELKERELKAVEDWEKLNDAYTAYETLRAELEPELASYAGIEEARDHLHALLQLCRAHEAKIVEYTIKAQQYEKMKTEIEAAQAEITILTAIRKGLQDIKPKVKSYLIPSLSRVASNLLSQMTNGARSLIEISDDFDIKVDGTDVETLSGSGKSVANLAVRLGLGTVLTNKVFSVLMVDEIDAFMDKNRGEYVAECLDNLKKVFGQIINISHKSVKADHYIEL